MAVGKSQNTLRKELLVEIEPAVAKEQQQSVESTCDPSSLAYTPSPEQFKRCAPFHIVANADGCIMQVRV